MGKIKAYVCRTLVPAAVLAGGVLVAAVPVGCRTSVDVDGVQFLSGDFSVPQITGFEVQGSDAVRMSFTKPVSVTGAAITSADGGTLAYECRYGADGSGDVTFALAERTEVGAAYTLDAQVTDQYGNTLTLSVPFTGFNDRVPLMALSEVRNAYGEVTDNGQKVKKGEYVELLVLGDGNTSGLELVSAGDGEKKKYTFPSIEVRRGEYVTVHLRRIATYTGMTDDTAEDLALSTAPESCDTALDLWADNEKARLAENDIVLLRFAPAGAVLDALAYSKGAVSEWPPAYAEVAAAVEASGVWQDADGNASCAPGAALDSTGMTVVNRSLSRQNCALLLELTAEGAPDAPLPNSASDWMVTERRKATKKKAGDDGVTPGYANSSNRYTPRS